ncbi:MAG: Trm112 family protein [Nitrosopumilaceae archaeon]|nr:Trm112 family protein [Nitrosopumilaceae archaeon]
MNKTMIDILACPIDKHHPLELFELKQKDDIISEGALYCTECSRFYPIIEEIPIMLPDDLRDKKQDIEFLKNNKDKLPEKITESASPWHL